MRNLIVILGDQLNDRVSSLVDFDKSQDHILMAEVWQEATHIRHHQKKLVFTFSSMRHFAKQLKQSGYTLTYQYLDDSHDSSFESVVATFLATHNPQKIILTSPSEYRVLEKIRKWSQLYVIDVEIREDTRFLCSKAMFANWVKDRKTLVMEHFYRQMRKTTKILMDGAQPAGGQWNYDKLNRKPLKNNNLIPDIVQFTPDEMTQQVITLVNNEFASHFGTTDNFHYAVTRDDAFKALAWFVEYQLPYFGDYQDAMLENKPWLYHSILSLYINIGLLLPHECIDAAIDAYHKKSLPINAVEGYIRQILGWREYVNGIYWLKMPDYKSYNFLQAKRTLPDFFWHGKTKLNCLSQCISQTVDNAYAHHIQRLMVLGNFCLLIGVDPDYVNQWYWIVYADAYEWVELPNVSGMVLFADGGLLASKPYAASGAYINKMSNYCENCHYDVKQKVGARACPFNYLYWNFVNQNKQFLSNNQRMRMIYTTLEKMSEQKIAEITQSSQQFLYSLEESIDE